MSALISALPTFPETIRSNRNIGSGYFVLAAPHTAVRRTQMKKLILAVVAAGLLTTGAMAQTTVTTGIARDAVQIEPEYRTKIKTYVTEKKLRPITTTERITVGTSVPANIELQAVPSDWGPSLTKYRYVYSNDRVMFVDPDSRRVVYEFD
jgi:hypothetical protein